MREKKSMRKAIDHDALMKDMERINQEKNKKNKSLDINNSDLFSVNVKKDGLKQKRAKLAADRFKPEQHSQSPYEAVLIKRLRDKKAAQGESAQVTKKQKKSDKNSDLVDIWATPSDQPKNVMEFNAFKTKATRVKSVVAPMGGQSFNPSAKDHAQTLHKVIGEAEKDIEEQQRIMKSLDPELFQSKESKKMARENAKQNEADNKATENDLEVVNKTVDRLNKLTKTERNKMAMKKANRDAQQAMTDEKNFQKQINRIPMTMKEVEQEAKAHKQAQEDRKRQRQAEKEHQEKTGLINKPTNVGRFKYKMKNTEFQLEEELAGNLRQSKPLGNENLLRDRFDSVFRRNLVEPDAPSAGEKKRQLKQKYKMKDKKSAAYGTMAAKLDKKNKKLKQKNDDKEDGPLSFINNDLIML